MGMIASPSQARASVRDVLSMIAAPREGSVLPELVVWLNGLLGSMGAAYRPTLEPGGWKIESICHSGDETIGRLAQETARFLVDAPIEFAHYDALSVQPDQQNTLVDQHAYRRILATSAPLITAVHEPLGLMAMAHMRVTVTDGPFLLSWLGVFREVPFTRAEESLLRAIIGPLQARLHAERLLWAGAPGSPLGQLLELVTAPALVFTQGAQLVHANAAGRAWLDRDRSILREASDALVDGPRGTRVASVTALTSLGQPTHHVVVLRDAVVERRLASVTAAHRLTRAEADVLARIVAGDANKDVAARLRCAPRTVESHVGSILDKCQLESRARLIAWFWTRP